MKSNYYYYDWFFHFHLPAVNILRILYLFAVLITRTSIIYTSTARLHYDSSPHQIKDLPHGFDVIVNNQVAFTLNSKNEAEKTQWMTSLATLLSNSSLQRMLDSKLSEEEKRYELKIPSPEIYKFDFSDKNAITVELC